MRPEIKRLFSENWEPCDVQVQLTQVHCPVARCVPVITPLRKMLTECKA
jgi:hypothetical protein